MKEKHRFQFFEDFKELLTCELTFSEARPKGFELAVKCGKPVKMWAYNEYLYRWELMGTYYPDGKTCVNCFGETCEYDKQTDHFSIIKKSAV